MDYQAIYARILQTVDQRAYQTPSVHVDPSQRAAMEELERCIQAPDFRVDDVRAQVRAAFRGGRIDRVMMLSALHVIACHPRVADWEEAARLVGEQEFAALEMGGSNLQSNLASVDRHRGVLAYLRGHYGVALDYFSRTLERQRSAENLQNILCTLLRLDEEAEAAALLAQIRRSFPSDLVEEIDRSIQNDPDLALLRSEAL
jgi:hypothetical protein